MPSATENSSTPQAVSITPLLKSLHPQDVDAPDAKAEDIAAAVSQIFTNELSPVQASILLYNLAITKLDQRPDILAACASAMRNAALGYDLEAFKDALEKADRGFAGYGGGLCDIVGTGGDYHSTFNISTASSIIASSLLMIAKHGNRASTSKSGSADILQSMSIPVSKAMSPPQAPKLTVVGPESLPQIYAKTNYAFLFAPNFHPGMKHAAGIRKEIPTPTIFNLLGPLANPLHDLIEARVIGVKKRDLVPVFAEALKLSNVQKGMVVCGDEDLDEISCAGPTQCSRLVGKGDPSAPPHAFMNGNSHASVYIQNFTISPEDFGLRRHPLSTVSPGLTPQENAKILGRLVAGGLGEGHPILDFVLMNAAALFVISGICDSEKCPFGEDQNVITETGPGGLRWKEGVRLAKLAIRTSSASNMLRVFTEITNELAES